MMFFADLLDRRGRVRKSDSTPIDVAAGLVPALVASVLPVYGPVASALSHVPLAARLLHLIVPIVICALTVHAIVTRSRVAKPAGITPRGGEEYEYTYKSGMRAVAKFIFLPVAILFLFECFDKLPNWMFMRKSVRGYVCDARAGTPLDVVVVINDSLGRSLGTSARTDDTGYLSVTLPAWGQRPTSISTGSGCESVDLTTAAPITTAGCPSSAAVKLPPRSESAFWKVSCAPKR